MSTFDDMVQFIKSAWPARKFIVPCLEGPAGIGKTAAVRQAAHEIGAGKVITIIASQILPNEVSGITMPVVETKAMEIFDHYRLSSLEDGDVLFFDELLEADQLVLSACLTLIESRELMSGRKLPDCMVVAATNPTIQPNMLKENIRQRFVWRKFELDREGTRNYIKQTCGFDIGRELADKLVTTGNEYNILSPRSMTKMCQWMSQANDEDEARQISDAINACWNSELGSMIRQCWSKKFNDPEMQVRNVLKHAAEDCSVDLDFDNASITDLILVLQELPEWDTIKAQLESTELKQDDEVVNF